MTILFPVLLAAEYRVYELQITGEDGAPKRTVQSTLDHLQYPSYYPLNPGEAVEYVRSWKCWGNHSHFAPHCPPPQNAPENPATPPDEEVPVP